jgi:hypothetical protein
VQPADETVKGTWNPGGPSYPVQDSADDDIDKLGRMTGLTGGGRVWRLRKLHQSIDATLADAGGGVELQFLLNGEVMYTRRWPTRALALADAASRRAELEREGWMPHW